MLKVDRHEAARTEDDAVAVDKVACDTTLETLTVHVHLPKTRCQRWYQPLTLVGWLVGWLVDWIGSV